MSFQRECPSCTVYVIDFVINYATKINVTSLRFAARLPQDGHQRRNQVCGQEDGPRRRHRRADGVRHAAGEVREARVTAAGGARQHQREEALEGCRVVPAVVDDGGGGVGVASQQGGEHGNAGLVAAAAAQPRPQARLVQRRLHVTLQEETRKIRVLAAIS